MSTVDLNLQPVGPVAHIKQKNASKPIKQTQQVASVFAESQLQPKASQKKIRAKKQSSEKPDAEKQRLHKKFDKASAEMHKGSKKIHELRLKAFDKREFYNQISAENRKIEKDYFIKMSKLNRNKVKAKEAFRELKNAQAKKKKAWRNLNKARDKLLSLES